ncbi:DoxX family protein [Paenibacillus silvisoli]|uniref:DoxX family protein n=1 Tax=Paenibacillus silvisoli TaxID=3110539 RepID=UPI002804BB53|nr:DoxX family protein [Paenibacillus silvisoli]
MLDLGLLLIRLVIGVTLMGHGAQKLFGWFGGYGPKGTGGWMESVGFKPGVLMAVLAGLAEMTGGLLFAAGLLPTIGAALIVLAMLGAIKVHVANGYWVDKGGFEYPFALAAVAIAIALIGPGAYAIG